MEHSQEQKRSKVFLYDYKIFYTLLSDVPAFEMKHLFNYQDARFLL
jgi:hypothetical protein